MMIRYVLVILVVMLLILSEPAVLSFIVEASEVVTDTIGIEPVGEGTFPLDITMLATFLKGIAFLGGAPALAYYMMKPIGKEMALIGWNDFSIRVVSLALTACIAWAAWAFLIPLLGEGFPITWQEWVNKLFAIASGAFLANQIGHGFAQKRAEHGGLT